MTFGNVKNDIDTFMETFAKSEEMKAIDMIDALNQIIEYSKEQPYSKEGLAGILLNGWMAGFMVGYRHGKNDSFEKEK